jgi:hypothetical protein
MIQNRDHQLCEQYLDRLMPSSLQNLTSLGQQSGAWLGLNDQVVVGCDWEKHAMAVRRTLTRRQRQLIMQPVADSLSGGPMDQLRTFDVLPD